MPQREVEDAAKLLLARVCLHLHLFDFMRSRWVLWRHPCGGISRSLQMTRVIHVMAFFLTIAFPWLILFVQSKRSVAVQFS